MTLKIIDGYIIMKKVDEWSIGVTNQNPKMNIQKVINCLDGPEITDFTNISYDTFLEWNQVMKIDREYGNPFYGILNHDSRQKLLHYISQYKKINF